MVLSFSASEAHDLSRGLAKEQIINRTASAVFSTLRLKFRAKMGKYFLTPSQLSRIKWVMTAIFLIKLFGSGLSELGFVGLRVIWFNCQTIGFLF